MWGKETVSLSAARQSYRCQLMERVMVAPIKRRLAEILELRGWDVCLDVETWGFAELRHTENFQPSSFRTESG